MLQPSIWMKRAHDVLCKFNARRSHKLYQHIVLSKYTTDDFGPLIQHIMGVEFEEAEFSTSSGVMTALTGESEGRLFYLYNASSELPAMLSRIVKHSTGIDVSSVFVATYAHAMYSDEVNLERDAEMDVNQLMLNFVSDEGALVWVTLAEPLTENELIVEVRYETLQSKLHMSSGAQIVEPVERSIDVDFRDLLELAPPTDDAP